MSDRNNEQQSKKMSGNNSAWALLQYIEFVRGQNQIVTGREIKFTREKSSNLDCPAYGGQASDKISAKGSNPARPRRAG